jgi:hypothetical protein
MTVILENLAIVMTYALSQKALAQLYSANFCGTSRFLERAFFELPRQQATRALVELAVMYRALDDVQDITSRRGTEPFGHLYNNGDPPAPLPLRELTNKIIHADRR